MSSPAGDLSLLSRWEWGEVGKLSMDGLPKAGVPVGTDPENVRGFGQGQEGPHESHIIH